MPNFHGWKELGFVSGTLMPNFHGWKELGFVSGTVFYQKDYFAFGMAIFISSD